MGNGSNSLECMLNSPFDTILALKGPHGGPPMAPKGPHWAKWGPKLGPFRAKIVSNRSVSIDLSVFDPLLT